MLTKQEVEQLRKNAKVHKLVFDEIKKIIKPWLDIIKINELCHKITKEHNVLCWFKWLHWFPDNICISINDVVAHGIPRKWLILNSWDLLNVDFWIKDKKFQVNTDSGFSVIVWWDNKNPKWAKMIEANIKALNTGIKMAKVWNTIWDISYAIGQEIEWAWYKVVKDLTWHGVWKKVHEKPYIPNYWQPWTWIKIIKWMVLAIEPILWETSWEIYDKWDWEMYIKDGSLWCQYEHTILITDWEAEIII